jgi:hypothetical protein
MLRESSVQNKLILTAAIGGVAPCIIHQVRDVLSRVDSFDSETRRVFNANRIIKSDLSMFAPGMAGVHLPFISWVLSQIRSPPLNLIQNPLRSSFFPKLARTPLTLHHPWAFPINGTNLRYVAALRFHLSEFLKSFVEPLQHHDRK